MTKKTYRSAQGKVVDLGALVLRNEDVKAVGNMGVNARGDVVDAFNQPIDTKAAQVRRHYSKQTMNNDPVSQQRKPK
jgi:flagellar biosynthesis/type III secretory pathway ATPase